MIVGKSEPIKMRIETDPVVTAKYREQMARFDKNSDWLQAHIPEVYNRHRGKCICVAGQELFVADTGPEAVALANKAHPEDDGWLLRYIPKEKMERVYGYFRTVASL